VTLDVRTAADIEQAAHALRTQLLREYSKDGTWLRLLEDADLRVIVMAIKGFGALGANPFAVEAAREAARSVLEIRLTDRLIERMEALETASTHLASVAIRVGKWGVVVGLLGVLVAIAIAWASA